MSIFICLIALLIFFFICAAIKDISGMIWFGGLSILYFVMVCIDFKDLAYDVRAGKWINKNEIHFLQKTD